MSRRAGTGSSRGQAGTAGRHRRAFRRPLRWILLPATVLVAAEAVILWVLQAAPPLPWTVKAALGATVLAAVVIPALHFLLYRRVGDEARERYRLLFEEAPILCVTTGAERGQPVVTACNRNFLEALGYRKAEVLGRPLADFYTAASHRALLGGGGYQRTLEGRFGEEERVLVRKDGSTLSALLRARPLPGNDGSPAGTLAVFMDLTEHQRLLDQVRESESLFRAAFDQAAVGMAVLTPGGQWLRVNRKLAELLGCPPEQLVSRDFRDFTHPDDRPANEDLVRQVACGDRPFFAMEKRYLRQDGSALWVHVTVGPVRAHDGDLQYVVSVVEDISARKSAEDRLRESEERFRELFDHMGSGVFVYEPLPGEEDFVIRDMNRAGQRIAGVRRAEVCGSRVTETFPGVRDSGLFAVLRQVARTGQAERLPLTHYRHAARSVWVETYAYRLPSGEVVAVFEDVTDRCRAEASLARLGAALEQVGEAVILTDLDRRIQHVNAAFSTVTGYGSDEAAGQEVKRLLRGGAAPEELHTGMWEAIARGETWRGRFRNRRKDGGLYLADATISPVRDESGAVTGYVSTQRDVTREAALEERLRQAQKLEAVGQLAGGVAHDFNTVLTVILGQAELLLEGLPPDSPTSEGLRTIQGAGERAADLTRQLLTFGRRQALQPRTLDLGRVLRNTEKMLRGLLGKRAELVLLVAPDLGRVRADPTQMAQVLINLAVNARDAMPGGGTLTIEARNQEAGCHLAPEPGAGATVVLSVRDTGAGMDEPTRRRAFEPFFTTKPPGKGTGLGLATVYGIVEQSGGHIRLASKPGQGTEIHLYLPRVSDPEGGEGAALPPADRLTTGERAGNGPVGAHLPEESRPV